MEMEMSFNFDNYIINIYNNCICFLDKKLLFRKRSNAI